MVDHIELKFILGNCFYLLAFTPSDGLPKMNIDVVHKGIRGGSARTRYFGKIEGVHESSKKKLYEQAKRRGISVHELLEEMIATNLPDQE